MLGGKSVLLYVVPESVDGALNYQTIAAVATAELKASSGRTGIGYCCQSGRSGERRKEPETMPPDDTKSGTDYNYSQNSNFANT